MLQRLFVLRFHFTEVFEDSCRQPAKTHNWTKETGVHRQEGEKEYSVGGKLISSSLCLRSPYPRSSFEIVALPEFVWVYSSLRGQTMPPISFDTFAFSVNSPFMVLVFYQVMSAMGRGLNYSNYISSCVILCWSNIGLLWLACMCYLSLVDTPMFDLAAHPSVSSNWKMCLIKNVCWPAICSCWHASICSRSSSSDIFKSTSSPYPWPRSTRHRLPQYTAYSI